MTDNPSHGNDDLPPRRRGFLTRLKSSHSLQRLRAPRGSAKNDEQLPHTTSKDPLADPDNQLRFWSLTKGETGEERDDQDTYAQEYSLATGPSSKPISEPRQTLRKKASQIFARKTEGDDKAYESSHKTLQQLSRVTSNPTTNFDDLSPSEATAAESSRRRTAGYLSRLIGKKP